MILLGLTGVGEVLIYAYIKLFSLNWDTLLAARLTMIMLPYLLLVCGTAFLGSILQVHRRFVAITATAVVSNVCLIIAMLWGKHRLDLSSDVGQSIAVRWLSYSVLIAGEFQIGMLLPSLRKVGFRFHLSLHFWTPAVRKMILLTVPVAMSAGVLQISVLSDKGIAFILSQRPGATTMRLFGHVISLPMVEGATQRLNSAQFMYQFPLGVFAIALATAIFPKLSTDAHDEHTQAGDRSIVPDEFKAVLRRSVESCLFIGLPASVGMIVVCRPAVKLLFQHGSFTAQECAMGGALHGDLLSGDLGLQPAADSQPGLLRAARHDDATDLGHRQPDYQYRGGDSAAVDAIAGIGHGGRHVRELRCAGRADALDAGPALRWAGAAQDRWQSRRDDAGVGGHVDRLLGRAAHADLSAQQWPTPMGNATGSANVPRRCDLFPGLPGTGRKAGATARPAPQIGVSTLQSTSAFSARLTSRKGSPSN